MVYCLIQQDAKSLEQIVSFIANISNLKLTDTIVVACTEDFKNEIQNFIITIPDIHIDFFEIENLKLSKVTNQFCNIIRYCLDKYNEVLCLDENALLINTIDVSHLSKSGIGFLKKMHIVPNEHYSRLFSREIFYCSNKDMFEKYAKIVNEAQDYINNKVLDGNSVTIQDFILTINEAIDNFIKTQISIKNTDFNFNINFDINLDNIEDNTISEEDDTNDINDINVYSDEEQHEDEDEHDNVSQHEDEDEHDNVSQHEDEDEHDNVSQHEDEDEHDNVSQHEDVSETKIKFTEDDFIINGQVLTSEDFFGTAKNKLSEDDFDFDNFIIHRYFNQIREEVFMKNTDETESLSLINKDTNIAAILLRNDNIDDVINISLLIHNKLFKCFPRIVPFLSFKNNKKLPISIPTSSNLIGLWNRNGYNWFDGLKKLLLYIDSIYSIIKTLPSTTYFKFVEKNIISSPDTQYLTPDLQVNGFTYLTNYDAENNIIDTLNKFNIKHEFLFYYPENVKLLEKILNVTNVNFIDDNLNEDDEENNQDNKEDNQDNEEDNQDNEDKNSESSQHDSVTNSQDDKDSENNESTVKTLYTPIATNKTKTDDDYEIYINDMLSHSFVVLNKDNFSCCIIAEAMACGKPLIISDDINIFDIEEGKHYIRETHYYENQEKYNDETMFDNMSSDCKDYFMNNIHSSAITKNIFNKALLFDMTNVLLPASEVKKNTENDNQNINTEDFYKQSEEEQTEEQPEEQSEEEQTQKEKTEEEQTEEQSQEEQSEEEQSQEEQSEDKQTEEQSEEKQTEEQSQEEQSEEEQSEEEQSEEEQTEEEQTQKEKTEEEQTEEEQTEEQSQEEQSEEEQTEEQPEEQFEEEQTQKEKTEEQSEEQSEDTLVTEDKQETEDTSSDDNDTPTSKNKKKNKFMNYFSKLM
jgi:hypothetical protein